MLIVIIKTVKMCAISLIGLGFSPFACLVQPPNSVKGGGGRWGGQAVCERGGGQADSGPKCKLAPSSIIHEFH